MSFISTLPIRAPPRIAELKYGAFDIDSMPPATTTSISPSAIDWYACTIAFAPEPHTLFTVVQGT